MRGVSSGFFRSVALLTLLVVLTAPTLIAAEGPPPPPDARVSPPIGVASDARIQPPIGTLDLLFFVWLLAKIGPPIG